MPNQDWSKFKHLSKESKKNIEPTLEFKKSESINRLYKIQDGIAKKDPKFALALEREIRFLRHSK